MGYFLKFVFVRLKFEDFGFDFFELIIFIYYFHNLGVGIIDFRKFLAGLGRSSLSRNIIIILKCCAFSEGF